MPKYFDSSPECASALAGADAIATAADPGFAVETHDSGEYRCVRGKLQRNRERITVRGLNDNHNKDLKSLFKSAAISASTRPGPLHVLHVVALNEGLRRKKALWRPAGRNELESLILAPWASRRRQDLLDLFDQLTPKIQELTRAPEEEVEKRPVTRRLMTHPGVGPLTALAFELVIGTPERFHCGKQIASYVGLVPSEESSGDRRRLGHISKQGNSLLRYLLVEAAQVTVRSHPQWRSKFFHLAMRRGRKIAKVAMARKLAVRLYWMWRQGWDYGQFEKLGSHAGAPGNRHGAQ